MLSPDTQADASGSDQATSFPVVGIGASAGGLEAITELVRNLKPSLGMAYVYVQHMDPEHDSAIPDILAREASIRVVELAEGMRLEVDCFYVMPSRPDVVLDDDVLHLRERPQAQRRHMPIDQFLSSLAQARGSQAVAVLLSGTGSDGTAGLMDVKAGGGITFVQDHSARYDAMPKSAIATGQVDFVLGPTQIAERLARIAEHPYLNHASAEREIPREEGFEEVLAILKRHTGVDFTRYKQGTLARRTQRRMALHRARELSEYVARLRSDRQEVQALYQDLLINVTGFYRDRQSFEVLTEQVFPKLVHERADDDPIRIWVPGCASGEEVYSIAMALLDFLEARSLATPIKLFGTDISVEVLAKARNGVYTEGALAEVPEYQVRRYFRRLEGGYRISSDIREACVFAHHDLGRDPPFAQIDLISCRNVLIYFDISLQRRVLPLFHYALKPNGYLVLGSSEDGMQLSELFETAAKGSPLFIKNPRASTIDLPRAEALDDSPTPTGSQTQTAQRGTSFHGEADRFVVARYGPPGLVVDRNDEIQHVRGDTDPFLKTASGAPSHNLVKMARPGLLGPLREALAEARQSHNTITRPAVRVTSDDHEVTINLNVVPLRDGSSGDDHYYLVLFERPAAPSRGTRLARGLGNRLRRIWQPRATGEEPTNERLRRELDETRGYLSSLIEESEARNEELQAAHEEMLSSNEELQSTNEELETAKEELQASNEELETLNQELHNRNSELAKVNDDLENLHNSVNIPIVILSRDLRIRRFTPAANKVVAVTEADLGRPFADIRLKLDVPELEPAIERVMHELSPEQREVQDLQGRWYSLNIRPYRTRSDQIDGAVISLLDIDSVKRGQQALVEARAYAEAIVQTVPEPLVLLDAELRVQSVNRAFYETFQVAEAETVGRKVDDIGRCDWDIPELRQALATARADRARVEDLEVEHDFAHIGKRVLRIRARHLRGHREGEGRILLAIEDMTDRRRAERERQDADLAMRRSERLASVGTLAAGIAHEINNPVGGILLSTELARASVDEPDTVQQALADIETQANRCSEIIGEVLKFARRDNPESEPMALNEVVEAGLRLIHKSAQHKGTHLELALAEDLPELHGRSGEITQVVVNLIQNAVQAGAHHCTIRTGRANEHLFVSVRDDGGGIADKDLPTIFDSFYTTHREERGTGLGLSISKRIVEEHGGTIEVDSTPGEGTVMSVYLPLDKLGGEAEPSA